MRLHDEDDDVERKNAVRTTTEWPKLDSCRNTRPPPPSWSPLAILPDDLIVEILMRLPVSSLVQFRSVCKSWRTLISCPQFAKDHLQRSIADPTLTHPRCAYNHFKIRCHNIGVFSLQSLFENRTAPSKVVCFGGRCHLSVMGSCNGLLYLHHKPNADDKESRAILWNPCTGLTSEWLEIGCRISASGFGHDHVNDKYKLFVASLGKAKIFTFGPNHWRTIQDFPFRVSVQRGVLVSGALNWLYNAEKFIWVIVSLDLGKETYDQFSLPDRDSDDNLFFTPALGVLRNCLVVCFEHKKTHWLVWLMKEYGVHQSWTKLAMIPHHPFDHPNFLSLLPLYFSENDVLLARVPNPKSRWCKLVQYNLNDGRVDFPLIDSSSDGMFEYPLSEHVGTRTFVIYHESLVSPSQLGLRSSFSEMPLIKPTKSIIS